MEGENGKICTYPSPLQIKVCTILTALFEDHGSCHCGAVRLAVKVKPLETWDTVSNEDESVVECNCSICVRVSLHPVTAYAAILSGLGLMPFTRAHKYGATHRKSKV